MRVNNGVRSSRFIPGQLSFPRVAADATLFLTPPPDVAGMCAKKGRVARILTTLHRVAGTPISEALKRRQRAAIQRGDAGTHTEKSQWKKRKERRQRREAFEGAAVETGLPHGYHSGMRVLLVGEGNLSFALALVTLFDGDGANVLATSLDKRGVAVAAYDDFEDIVQSLEAAGAATRFGVDVEDGDALRRVARQWWASGDDEGAQYAGGVGPGGVFKGFDRIVWNFPGAGVGTVGWLSVRANQDAIAAFFRASRALLAKDGEIHVAVPDDEARARAAWNIPGIAAREGVRVSSVARLRAGRVPGILAFQDASPTIPYCAVTVETTGTGMTGTSPGAGTGTRVGVLWSPRRRTWRRARRRSSFRRKNNRGTGRRVGREGVGRTTGSSARVGTFVS